MATVGLNISFSRRFTLSAFCSVCKRRVAGSAMNARYAGRLLRVWRCPSCGRTHKRVQESMC
ncbi:MAG: hypothetical protein KAU20_03515 [Nanoarchaeota archaeon]|nr:hypothetical protein [Nanoarchaeota archaeon]